MSVVRTDPSRVTAVLSDLRTPYHYSASGYGRKIPTRYRVRYDNRWRRVYAMCYGNAASVYITVDGAPAFLDIATEYALSDGLSSPELGIV